MCVETEGSPAQTRVKTAATQEDLAPAGCLEPKSRQLCSGGAEGRRSAWEEGALPSSGEPTPHPLCHPRAGGLRGLRLSLTCPLLRACGQRRAPSTQGCADGHRRGRHDLHPGCYRRVGCPHGKVAPSPGEGVSPVPSTPHSVLEAAGSDTSPSRPPGPLSPGGLSPSRPALLPGAAEPPPPWQEGRAATAGCSWMSGAGVGQDEDWVGPRLEEGHSHSHHSTRAVVGQ